MFPVRQLADYRTNSSRYSDSLLFTSEAALALLERVTELDAERRQVRLWLPRLSLRRFFGFSAREDVAHDEVCSAIDGG